MLRNKNILQFSYVFQSLLRINVMKEIIQNYINFMKILINNYSLYSLFN